MRPSSFFSLKVFSRQTRLLYLCLISFALIVFLSYLFIGKDFTVLKYPSINNDQIKTKPQLNDILGGALNLSPASFQFSFLNLEGQMQALLLDTRPDDLKNTKYLELFLSDKEFKTVAFGEKVFLRYFPEVNGYEFSSDPTDIWLLPFYKDGVNVKIFAKYQLDGKEIKKEKEIKIKLLENEVDPPSSEDYNSLKDAKWIGLDQFEELYGEKKSFKQRLIINGAIFEVSKGDLLIYKDGRWQTGVPSDGCPIAMLNSLTANSLEFYFWPKEVLKKQTIVLSPSSTSPPITLSDEFIADLHLRSLKVISCQVEKQRIIMKEKDLLLKKDGKWKIIKLHQLKNEKLGDFLVFDSIENDGGAKIFKGYLFNKDRTQVIKIQKKIIHRKDSMRKKKIIR